MARLLFEPLFTSSSRTHREAVSLARLVKAEIVSSYRGISINTGMGNPTSAINRGAWKINDFERQVGRRTFCTAFIKGRGSPVFTHAFFLLCSSILALSSSSAQVLTFTVGPQHVRSGRQVDGLLCHGGGHYQASGGRITGRGHRA